MYFIFTGYLLLACSCLLLLWRLYFLINAEMVIGKISKYKFIQSLDTEQGKSKHLVITYMDLDGQRQNYILDNALITYFYEEGDEIRLAL